MKSVSSRWQSLLPKYCVFVLFQGPQFHLRCNSLCHYFLHHGEPCPSLPPWPHWDSAGGSPPNAAPEWHTVSDLGPALHVLLLYLLAVLLLTWHMCGLDTTLEELELHLDRH